MFALCQNRPFILLCEQCNNLIKILWDVIVTFLVGCRQPAQIDGGAGTYSAQQCKRPPLADRSTSTAPCWPRERSMPAGVPGPG
jgi:hypothetical protein